MTKERQKRVASTALTILWGIFTALVAVLFFAERYLMDNWGDLSADEVVYHLKSSLDGTNPDMIRDGVLHYGLPAAAVVAVVFVLFYVLRAKEISRKAFVAGTLAVELAVLLFVKTELDRRLALTDYIRFSLLGSDSDFIADNYVDPDTVKLTFPEEKRNLIFIFLESAEITYADQESGGAFERNVIPELTELALESEDFSGDASGTESGASAGDDSGKKLNGGISLPGSTWTMGAMFAMATGAPLKVPINGNNIRDEESFFPRMASLGTILQEQGYEQELLIGSKAFFGGRDVFYKGHGGFQIRDYNYAIKNGRIPKDYHVFWGYEDEKLFQFAREDLAELSSSGKPFNLTMLTVDTHFEDGYRCRLCRDDFGEQYADAFACSSRQVTEFVKWVQQQDFYKNTTIVICGDHPTMDVDFCKAVPENYLRKTYVAIVNGKTSEAGAQEASTEAVSAQEAESQEAAPEESGTQYFRHYSTMDLFPTTLAAMDVQIEGDRLGLGVNLYSEEQTLIEQYGLSECKLQLTMPSAFMDGMSGIRITEALLEEIAGYVTIGVEELEGDKVRFSLKKLGDYLNYTSVEECDLVITDKKTGQQESFSLTPTFETLDDKNLYTFDKIYEMKGRDVEDLWVEYYITTEDSEHCKIADLENNRE